MNDESLKFLVCTIFYSEYPIEELRQVSKNTLLNYASTAKVIYFEMQRAMLNYFTLNLLW